MMKVCLITSSSRAEYLIAINSNEGTLIENSKRTEGSSCNEENNHSIYLLVHTKNVLFCFFFIIYIYFQNVNET